MLNKISVVMSNLNQGNFLELSIQSILNHAKKTVRKEACWVLSNITTSIP